MTVSKYEYYGPSTIEEACDLLEKMGDGAMVMAGGTDLQVKITRMLVAPKVVIGLKKIDGLNRISFGPVKGLSIGATALLADVAAHPKIKKNYPALAAAAEETANVQIRNMGTVVGNLCNGAPSAENAPALIALGGQVVIMSSKGTRHLPLDDFFKGPGITAIEPGEIVTAVTVPPPPAKSGASYRHISARGKVDISAVCVGVMVTMDGQTCREARIALGAVAPIPMRAVEAENMLMGNRVSKELIKKAGLKAREESKPISDMRASAEYRKKMVAVLTERALTEAYERALKG
jgi:CO/xanthine dehydrogenase FAD-binding subunit